MKIFEFMQPQRTDEALGTALKGIGSVAAQAVNKSLGTNLGGTSAGAQAAPGFAGQAAAQANQGMIKKLAQEQAELWAQSLQAALKQSGTPYTSQLNQAELVKIATGMVNRTLDRTGLDNYQQLISAVDQTKRPEAQALQKTITDLVTRLGKTAVSPTIRTGELERENQTIWNELATAIAKAQNLVTFNRKQLGTGQTAAIPPGGANPQLQAAMQATGINRATLAKLNAVVRQSGQKLNITTTGSATLDALLKAAKLL
jgi:hypothetical protein